MERKGSGEAPFMFRANQQPALTSTYTPAHHRHHHHDRRIMSLCLRSVVVVWELTLRNEQHDSTSRNFFVLAAQYLLGPQPDITPHYNGRRLEP
ncbi:hypothetical protein E2C01_048474 [Portunus trituberculatus]|uniref:Uncharacterized protein n=1 Tax=Portunus trituberculatus TaxID=210409 RepID=A0A5B7GB85_PORTR|nr:hypothetical protein [Portunus trituberculatus]